MRKTNARRFCALMLSLLMTAGVIPVYTLAADNGEDSGTGSGTTLQELSGDLVQATYAEYLNEYAPAEVSDSGIVLKSRDEVLAEKRADASVTIDALDYDKESTDAEVTEVDDEEKGGKALRTNDSGTVTWKFTVPKSGFYTFNLVYRSTNDNTVDIERVMYIDGRVPFQEARHLYLKKIWELEYAGDTSVREGVFQKDGNGNELRPDAKTISKWQEWAISDFNAYYMNPFEFYLEEGEHTFSLEGIRETADIKSITIKGYEPLPSYEEVYQSYMDAGYTAASAETIHLDAETPSTVSDYTIYPIYDRTSAITEPQHHTTILLNTIGYDKWQKPSQWIEYKFNITEPGLYNIVTRFKQSELRGVPASRKLYVDGEIPFEEARYCSFAYKTSWQTGALTDGYNTFEFYFEPGEHTIRFEVNLGTMTETVARAAEVMLALNKDYQEIIKLTGTTPDVNRDYGFGRIMPDVIADFSTQSYELKSIVEYITTVGGIRSDNVSALEQLSLLLDKMGSKEDEIAPNITNYVSQVSALGSWITNMCMQTLELDYIEISAPGTELPQAEANFGQAFMYEMKKFAGSFYADYNTLGGEQSETEVSRIIAWISSGRDQAQIIKNLINNGFSKETGISVDLQLVAAGTLLPSILAGVGPDVSLDAMSPIDMAIRGAVKSLNDFEGFDEAMTWFAESAIVPMSLYGETYALPTGQGCPVMFYRSDILQDLGLEIPQTWDELLSMVPVLQFNNMQVGVVMNPNLLLFQEGGEFWADDGMRVNWDSIEYLTAFAKTARYYTQYSLPYAFDAVTRIKNGEMPLVIAEYITYNTLVVSAPEIAGLWGFCQIPGTERVDEDGNTYIDHTAQSNVSGIIMPRGCRDEENAWKLMMWYAGEDFQVDYSNEMMALLGPSAKQAVANLNALSELPWSAEEYKVIYDAISGSKALPAYPGDYFVNRYAGFAMAAAYTEGEDPAEAVLSYVSETNQEITRKRKEFHLMVDDEWQAIKSYLELDNHDQWKEYAAENGIAYNKYSDDAYDFKDWMSERGITADKHDNWKKDVAAGKTTLSFKDYLAE